MAEVREEAELGASPEEVWKTVGDFGGLLKSFGMPVELEGPEGVGQLRTIRMGPSPTIERLELLDATAKRLQYSIVESGLPVENYLSTMELSDAGNGRTKLVWSSTFDVPEGTTEDDATKMVSGVYKGGIAGLQGIYGA